MAISDWAFTETKDRDSILEALRWMQSSLHLQASKAQLPYEARARANLDVNDLCISRFLFQLLFFTAQFFGYFLDATMIAMPHFLSVHSYLKK